MGWLLAALLVPALGSQTSRYPSTHRETPVAVCARATSPSAFLPATTNPVAPGAVLDLAVLWNLALEHNPTLQEVAARLEAARGKQFQATRYPNPQISYEQEDLGTSRAPAGSLRFQLTQEIVTGGKRKLDIAIAARKTDEAALALSGKKFRVLTNIRHAYADYLGWHYTVRVNYEVVQVLEKGREITRQLVEKAKTRPQTDLLRLDAQLEEAKINRVRSQINRQAAWRRLAAEVGIPELPLPAKMCDLPGSAVEWNLETILERVLAVHTDMRVAAVDVDRARLAVERARAEVVPNVTVGGGYSNNFAERDAGGMVSIQTRLPFWDRNQGNISAAQAELARAQASWRAVALRLSRDTSGALARYQGARQELDRLEASVLPKVEQSLKLIQQGYQSGAAQISFTDVLIAQQTLNDTKLKAATTRRELWHALAALQGLMQLELGEELGIHEPSADGPR